ncbi:MAG: hypothetical protein IKH61_10750 [Bacteroidales bacterium]|nr:hypothetical protein [Bacteroidales bacterium]
MASAQISKKTIVQTETAQIILSLLRGVEKTEISSTLLFPFFSIFVQVKRNGNNGIPKPTHYNHG